MGNFRQNVQDQLPKSRHFYFAYNAFQDVMAKEPPEQSSLSECYKFRVVSSQGPTSQEREKGQSCSCLRMASPNIKGKQSLIFNVISNNKYLFNLKAFVFCPKKLLPFSFLLKCGQERISNLKWDQTYSARNRVKRDGISLIQKCSLLNYKQHL